MSVGVVLDGDTVVLDSDAEEPATDYNKEELLRLRSGSLLSEYVIILRLSISYPSWMSLFRELEVTLHN